jgi:hypothetical protein
MSFSGDGGGEGTPGSKGKVTATGCRKDLGDGGAVSWNPEDDICYRIQGKVVMIGDTADDLQRMAQIANLNMSVSGQQIAVADNYKLPTAGATAYA